MTRRKPRNPPRRRCRPAERETPGEAATMIGTGRAPDMARRHALDVKRLDV